MKINKYYVGASHLGNSIMNGTNDSHTHATLEAAIQEGKELMQSGNRDCVIIVSIVRIIRRRDMPVVVEKV